MFSVPYFLIQADLSKVKELKTSYGFKFDYKEAIEKVFVNLERLSIHHNVEYGDIQFFIQRMPKLTKLKFSPFSPPDFNVLQLQTLNAEREK